MVKNATSISVITGLTITNGGTGYTVTTGITVTVSLDNLSPDNDNGIEGDADDQSSNYLPKSHPVIYNVTIMGNGKSTGSADNRGLAAVNLKDGAEGEIYNSVFANFRYGLNLIKSVSLKVVIMRTQFLFKVCILIIQCSLHIIHIHLKVLKCITCFVLVRCYL